MSSYDAYIQDNNGNTMLPITTATNVIETESNLNIKQYVDYVVTGKVSPDLVKKVDELYDNYSVTAYTVSSVGEISPTGWTVITED